MGQRSQIYVRYNNGDKKGLVANYYQWNYGERMISRARYGIESINEYLKYDWYFTQEHNVEKMRRMFDVNFDMKDIVMSQDIIEEWKTDFSDEDFNDYVFKMQDNNDGKLLVDIQKDKVKYAFLDYSADSDNIMNGEDYMVWNDNKDWRKSEYITKEGIKACEENITEISKMAELMTKEEVEEFINYNYVEEIPLLLKTIV